MQSYKETVGGGWLLWIMIVSLLLLVASTVAVYLMVTPPWLLWVMVGSTALTALFVVAFRSLTISVTKDEVTASWGGLINKRVPITEIQKATAGPYKWLEFGGWGWRFNFKGGTAFSQVGVGNAVYVHYGDGKVLAVTVREPEKAVEAIHEQLAT